MATSSGSAGLAAALIVAAGSGERLGTGGPKALVELAGRPMYEYSLDACHAAASVGTVVIAVPPGTAAEFSAAVGADAPRAQNGQPPALQAGVTGTVASLRLVDGGSTRSHSVAAGLALIDAELVVVHDAARPLVSPDLIDEAVAALEASPEIDAVIAAAPVTDTIKSVGGSGLVDSTLDRSKLRSVQTPQVFRRAALVAAIACGDLENATDDASLVESAGGSVAVLDSPSFNIKVTVPEDLAFAEAMLAERN